MEKQWNLKGHVLVACNCDWGCPCNFNALPTAGKCEGGWTWHVDAGNVDGVTLDGLNFSVYVNWPGAIHEGNGVALILIDVINDFTEPRVTLARPGLRWLPGDRRQVRPPARRDRTDSDLPRSLRGTGDKIAGGTALSPRQSQIGSPAVPGHSLRGSHKLDRRRYRGAHFEAFRCDW